jgi:hypothetical protein
MFLISGLLISHPYEKKTNNLQPQAAAPHTDKDKIKSPVFICESAKITEGRDVLLSPAFCLLPSVSCLLTAPP